MVCIVLRMRCPGAANRRSSSRVRRKKSMPIKVGSPPWNATTTSSTPRWAASSWAMYASCTSGGIRNPLPGYSSSLLRKKQYSQSRLQIAPVGLDITWKARGAVSAVIAGLPS